MPADLGALLAADGYAAGLGITLEQTDPVAVSMPITVGHLNFLGVGHGGVVFSVADCAFSLISNRAGHRALAIDAHLALTGPVREGDRLTAIAEEVRSGRRLATYRVTVTNQEDATVALFTGTVLIDNA